MRYGGTHEFQLKVVENSVHVRDLQATMLHHMGLDPERVTNRHIGRDFRLTDVEGRVIQAILALARQASARKPIVPHGSMARCETMKLDADRR